MEIKPCICGKWTESQLVIDWPDREKRRVEVFLDGQLKREVETCSPFVMNLDAWGSFSARVDGEVCRVVEAGRFQVVMAGVSRTAEEVHLPAGSLIFGFARKRAQAWRTLEEVTLSAEEISFRVEGYVISPLQALWAKREFTLDDPAVAIWNTAAAAGWREPDSSGVSVNPSLLDEPQPSFAVCQKH